MRHTKSINNFSFSFQVKFFGKKNLYSQQFYYFHSIKRVSEFLLERFSFLSSQTIQSFFSMSQRYLYQFLLPFTAQFILEKRGFTHTTYALFIIISQHSFFTVFSQVLKDLRKMNQSGFWFY